MKTDLKHWITALELAKHVVDAKSSVPCLSHVAIEATKGRICVKATDLERELRVRFDVAELPGSFKGLAIDHKAALALSRAAKKSGKTLALEPLRAGLRMQVGGRTFELEAQTTSEWPAPRKVPEAEPYVACYDARRLDRALAYVLPAVSRDETRFHLCGVHVAADGSLVSTDGHRLHQALDIGALVGGEQDQETLGLTTRCGPLLAAAIAKTKAPYVMARAWPDFWELHMQGPSLEVHLRERTITQAFPPYEQIIPKHTKRFTTPRRLLADSLETAAKVMKATGVDPTRRGVKVIANGDLRLSTDSFDEVLTLAKAAPELVTLGLNPGYLATALADGDELCEIRFGDEEDGENLAPVLVRPSDSLLAVVMPMRIGD